MTRLIIYASLECKTESVIINKIFLCVRLLNPGAAVGPDLCFNSNKKGEDGANCGRDKSGPVPCSAEYVSAFTTFKG